MGAAAIGLIYQLAVDRAAIGAVTQVHRAVTRRLNGEQGKVSGPQPEIPTLQAPRPPSRAFLTAPIFPGPWWPWWRNWRERGWCPELRPALGWGLCAGQSFRGRWGNWVIQVEGKVTEGCG